MADAGFDEVRFPTNIDFGVRGGPEFFTTIISTSGGQEQRNQNWAEQRLKFTAAHALKNQTDYDVLLAFFYARKGRARAFRYKDWTDFCSDMAGYRLNITDSAAEDDLPAQGTITPISMGASDSLGSTTNLTQTAGDGVTVYWQLVKTYASGGINQLRPITKPVYGNQTIRRPRIYVDGALYSEGAGPTGYDITDLATKGLIQFNVAPPDMDEVTADFLFDVPVRFDTDRMEGSLVHFDTAQWPGIQIVEVRV